jgi:hypothetical protein
MNKWLIESELDLELCFWLITLREIMYLARKYWFEYTVLCRYMSWERTHLYNHQFWYSSYHARQTFSFSIYMSYQVITFFVLCFIVKDPHLSLPILWPFYLQIRSSNFQTHRLVDFAHFIKWSVLIQCLICILFRVVSIEKSYIWYIFIMYISLNAFLI